MLSPKICKKIDHWVAKFPKDRQKSAVLPALRLVQEENGGHLTVEAMDAVARYLKVPSIAVYEVATFYSLYHLKPIGRYKLAVCKNISCQLNGCNTLIEHLKKRLGIQVGETTKDGLFTLVVTECLAACTRAPALQVNDKVYHDNLTKDALDKLLDSLKKQVLEDG